ncbi:unnamed protein product [Brachionus calyciflorus]|uniref:Uncharacterized protein n=1 Tax=Brachionus calyciflorus TaxID=104777 RepID=A0A813PB97_9BILA|nr:unnamed protein product [Brachionus calyciflorus]
MSSENLITPETKKNVDEYSRDVKNIGHVGREALGDLGQMSKEKAGEYIQAAHEASLHAGEKSRESAGLASEWSEDAKERAATAYKEAMMRGEEMAGHIPSRGLLETASESLQHAKEFVAEKLKDTSEVIKHPFKFGKEKIEHIGELFKGKVKISEPNAQEEQQRQTRA